MRAMLLIAGRELSAYLRTMSGYVIIAAVLFVQGLLFNAFALQGTAITSSQALGSFFYLSTAFTMICSVLLSMRLLSEEHQTGTIALLYSSPVRDVDIVVGKFLAGLAFLCVFFLASLYMPIMLAMYGKVSVGHIAAGYFGLFLLGSACMAIGTFGSALTRSQVLAAILSAVMVASLVVAWLAARATEQPLTDVFSALAVYGHYRPFEQGLVHLRHVVYFVLVTFVALFAATRVVEARRWK